MRSNTLKYMGTSRILFSFLWMGLGILGMIYGLRGFNWIANELNQNLTLFVKNIDIINDLLTDLIDVVDMVDQSLSTVEQSAIDAGVTLSDTRPMVDKTSQVVSKDVPQAIDEVQASMPSVIEAAGMIDHTLGILTKFKFTIPIPFGTDLEISLGVDYDPVVSLEDALTNLSGNLEGIPESMRALEGDLVAADTDLVVMSGNLIDVAYDLDLLRGQIADLNVELERMITSLQSVQESIANVQSRIPGQVTTARYIFIGVTTLLILNQIPSAYFGYIFIKEGVITVSAKREGEIHDEVSD